jgi:hypothetical protein
MVTHTAARIAFGLLLLLTGSAQARQTDRSLNDAARDFASAYLETWSAPNHVALASTALFYGPKVMFHGREMSYASLLSEKQRFAERWPDRTYRYRSRITKVACDGVLRQCTVWSLFDYVASNPQERRRSRGLGEHEMVISFLEQKPVIVSETSRVLRRGRVPRP